MSAPKRKGKSIEDRLFASYQGIAWQLWQLASWLEEVRVWRDLPWYRRIFRRLPNP